MIMKSIWRPGIAPVLLVCAFATGCSGLRQETDPYDEAWEALLRSQKWEETLTASEREHGQDGVVFYAVPEFVAHNDPSVDPAFTDLYPKLVSRAYFRLIAEALEADRRVYAAYKALLADSQQPENWDSERMKRELETASRRFLAHRRMLEGLRNWKAFNRYGSDDLDFFMQEQLKPSFALHRKGAEDGRIVDYLMTELADLYHKEGEGLRQSL